MLHPKRMRLIAALGGALIFSSAAPTPAGAQMVPIVPPVSPAVAGCVLAGDLSPCIAAAMPVSPIVVIPGSGSRNVEVHKDRDRSRQPGRVVVR
jgi:hypothetical protein